MCELSYADEELSIGDTTVELPESIADIVETDELVVVMMDTLAKSTELDERTYSRNVWGVECDGTVRWEIEKAEKSSGTHRPYTGIWMEGGDLWAYNWNGIGYRVNVENGGLEEGRLMK